jgi:BirA family biotin operon repressor/biotin-[acetyl-CoA-carboxylase] ligase
MVNPGSPSDLSLEALRPLLPGREIRTYPAVLSTAADAMAWARAGGASGSVVVADYQASPRGRGGLEWRVRPGVSLCFSMVLRPELPVEREGWLYTVGATALADSAGPDAEIEWPDRVLSGGVEVAALGLHAELGPDGVDWAVVNVLVPDAGVPRGPLVSGIVDAIERRLAMRQDAVLVDYLARCRTIGRRVRARLIPLGPGGLKIEGAAVESKLDGALTIETLRETHVSVRPQNLGMLEPLEPEGTTDPEPAYPDYRELYLREDMPGRDP